MIYALDALLLAVFQNGGRNTPDYSQLSGYVQVAGDKDNTDHLKVSGYGPAWQAGFTIYFLPLVLAAIAGYC